jgi:hypothetical protein
MFDSSSSRKAASEKMKKWLKSKKVETSLQKVDMPKMKTSLSKFKQKIKTFGKVFNKGAAVSGAVDLVAQGIETSLISILTHHRLFMEGKIDGSTFAIAVAKDTGIAIGTSAGIITAAYAVSKVAERAAAATSAIVAKTGAVVAKAVGPVLVAGSVAWQVRE